MPPHRTRRKTVREGSLERRLTAFELHIRDRVALTIAEFHEFTIEPRLRWLEMPWYKRWWIRATERIKRLFTPAPKLPFRTDDVVETTEKGDELFEGVHQNGVVTKVEADRLWVRRAGEKHPGCEYSPSVWRRKEVKKPGDEDRPADENPVEENPEPSRLILPGQ